MSSPIAVVGWEWNGNDMVDPDGICFHTLVRGGPDTTANVRGENRLVPALAGMQQGLFEVNDRTIEFIGFVRGDGADEDAQRADFWSNAIALAAMLDPTAFGTITITLPGGAEYTIAARPNPIPAYRMEVPSYGENSLTFESVDPNWTAGGS